MNGSGRSFVLIHAIMRFNFGLNGFSCLNIFIVWAFFSRLLHVVRIHFNVVRFLRSRFHARASNKMRIDPLYSCHPCKFFNIFSFTYYNIASNNCTILCFAQYLPFTLVVYFYFFFFELAKPIYYCWYSLLCLCHFQLAGNCLCIPSNMFVVCSITSKIIFLFSPFFFIIQDNNDGFIVNLNVEEMVSEREREKWEKEEWEREKWERERERERQREKDDQKARVVWKWTQREKKPDAFNAPI